MCTRILNNLNKDFIVTSRNMDWPHQVNTRLYFLKEGINKTGFDGNYIYKEEVAKHGISAFNWTSIYSSIVTMVGCDARGFATADGLNCEGLTVNVLYDKAISFDYSVITVHKGLSASRWGQYLLDVCANVNEVVNLCRNTPEFTLLKDVIPDNTISSTAEQANASFHLSISDKSGDSAIIEYRNGQFEIYHDERYTVVTNEPSFDQQLIFAQYWQFLWGQNPKAAPKDRLLSAPGGHTSVQKFERATFNLQFMSATKTLDDALAQTRSIAAACAVPLTFNSNEAIDKHSVPTPFSTTIWMNFSLPGKRSYYFSSSYSFNHVWLTFDGLTETGYLALINVSPDSVVNNQLNTQNISGCMNDSLITADPPFMI